MESHRTRLRSLHHPWLAPVPGISTDAAPSHVRGYSLAEAVEMFYRRDNWTAGFRWQGKLRSSTAQIQGKDPRGSINGSRVYDLTDIKATTYRSAYVGGRPPEPHIFDSVNGFRTRPGGSYETGGSGVARTFSLVTSCLYGHAAVNLENNGYYYLGENGSAEYAAASGGLNQAWMQRAGDAYYPQVGILGFVDITCASSPWYDTLHPQWPDWPSPEHADWPALGKFDWPWIKIIFSNFALGLGATYAGQDGTFLRVAGVTGRSVIDGQESTAYATIYEKPYTSGGASLGFAQLEAPEEGAENQFEIHAGWCQPSDPEEPSSGQETWYKYADGTGAPLYDAHTGEVVATDPVTGQPYTAINAPFR